MLSFWHVHGKDYAREAEEHPETEIVAVWDEVPERGRAEAAQRGVPFFADLDDLLARPEVDGVIVDTPTNLHRDVMVAAARAGKHIFTEKVIAATLREAEEIIAAVEQSGVKFVVSLRRLSHASTRTIKEIIDTGLLGDLTLVRVRDSHSGALPSDQNPRGWLVEHFFNQAQAQGGALIDLGCHPMYLTRYFLGRPESVSAAFGYVTQREVEDNAVVTLRYPGGAIGIVETGFVTRYSPFMIEVHGTQGSLLFSEMGIGEMIESRSATASDAPGGARFSRDGQLYIRSANLEGAANRWLVKEVTAAEAPPAFNQWVTHIQQDTTATENIALGLDLTALMEAAYHSAATGQAVRLDSLAHAG
jgi:predicted dehydrogenase